VIRESEDNKQQAFEEIWQMSRAITGKENWLLADIKQY
jgi:predicted lipid-binding transport protein (Tim44 family)